MTTPDEITASSSSLEEHGWTLSPCPSDALDVEPPRSTKAGIEPEAHRAVVEKEQQ